MIQAFLIAILAGVFSCFAEEEPPNVVLIISDDQGYADYSFMGHDMIKTPQIDKLASQSLVYERGYVTTAVCAPSLATILTGLSPRKHGWTGNDPANEVGGWSERQSWVDRFAGNPQLPRLLAERGYLSLHTGKYWQGDPKSVSGFTDSMGETHRHGSEYSLGIGRETMQPIWDFIQKAQDQKKPFTLWYAPFMPHDPHTPPERLEKKYIDMGADQTAAKYYGMCDWFDETCGKLLHHLEEKGLTDKTIIVYICDNGYGARQGRRGNVKASPYELGVRTPIMVKWPGKVAAKVDKENLASNLDILPTVLAACGIEIPFGVEGINLLDHDAVAKRRHLFLENYTVDMISADNPGAALRARSIVSNDWKLTIWREPHPLLKTHRWQIEIPEQKVELFDLQADPLEGFNLAGHNPEKVEELRRKLDAWWNPGP